MESLIDYPENQNVFTKKEVMDSRSLNIFSFYHRHQVIKKTFLFFQGKIF